LTLDCPLRTSDDGRKIIASVIIPVRNEGNRIARCLDSVLANDFPNTQYEILVVDGRSTDESRQIACEKGRHFPNLHLIDNEKEITASGLNRAIEQATGRYIFILGAHAEYPPNYIRACVEELEKGTADVVGGVLETKPGDGTAMAEAIALMSHHPFGVGNSAFRIGEENRFVDTVPYGAFRRELFSLWGGYREDLVRNQDLELNARIRAHGARIFLLSEAKPVYYNVPTLTKAERQAFLNGLWLGRAWIWYPVCFRCRHVVPAMFVLALLLCLLGGASFHIFALTGLIILGTYFSIALVSAAGISVQYGFRFLLLMPALFFSYHFTYGIGTLAGLLTARGKRA
jgi:glycosyltransferase involved in cell wall biosynthesis